MYVKKNLMLWVAVFALAMPLFFAGTASALYNPDGTKPNGTTGTWDITDHGKCVYGIDASGNITEGSETSRPDCIAHVFTSATDSTSAGCTSFTNAENMSHYWASTCVDGSGNGISLTGQDRTKSACLNMGGTWKQACVAGWTYTGPNDDGAPGFCYTKIDMTASGDYTAADGSDCPTTIYGFSIVSGATSSCTYNYGVAGIVPSTLKKKDGSTFATAGSWVDLSGVTSQGLCLANGGSWGTGVTMSGLLSVPTSTSQAANVTGTRAGCLECHNGTSQYNGYAERWKDTYRLTGHKNMLRKVTAGNVWAGPNSSGNIEVYTAWASGTLDFTTATAVKTSGTPTWSYPLLYLFGDWMAPAPGGLDVVVNTPTGAKYNGSSTYSCTPCHATGFSNHGAGVCTDSSITVSSSCTGTNVWVPMDGVQGASYTGAEPAASYPTVTNFYGAWDQDGIVCSRCHASIFGLGSNATGTNYVNVTDNNTGLAADQHNTTPGTNKNELVNNICYGCHQAMAKTNNGTGPTVDLGNPTTPGSISFSAGTGSIPYFGGHPIGQQFLNSPHARYTGSVTPNALGKYTLAANTPANYNSGFAGYVCRSSTTYAGGSILKTVLTGTTVTEIKSLADCQMANATAQGVPATSTAYWQKESQGACTTCHDVHNSLFVAGQEGMKKECEDCHSTSDPLYSSSTSSTAAPQVSAAAMSHPKTSGTPWDTTLFSSPCEACHMPNPTGSSFPMHLWRINTDATYSTFPSPAAYAAGQKLPYTALDDDGYNAIWTDLDQACGQCHGGSFGANATKNRAPYLSKAALSVYAKTIHQLNSISTSTAAPVVSSTTPTVTGWQVQFTDSSTDADTASTDTVTVSWGDGTVDTGAIGATFSHTYPSTRIRSYYIRHFVTDSVTSAVSREAIKVNVPQRYTLSGTVIDSGSNALNGAVVSLRKNGHTVKYVKTGSGNTFTFTGVLPGAYVVHAYKFGATIPDVDLGTVSADNASIVVQSTTP